MKGARSTGSKPPIRDREGSEFGKVLGTLRRRSGWKQEKLADEIGVSRSYLSLLESVDSKAAKKPSLKLLARICHALVIQDSAELSNKQLADLHALLFSALELPQSDPYRNLIGTPKDEGDRQTESWVKSVWIISPILGENLTDDLLNATVKNLRRGVQYTYFVPDPAEWEDCLQRLASALGGPTELADTGAVVAIKAPPLMCLPRIRVLNPGQGDADGSVTLGPLGRLDVHALEPEQVADVYRRLSRIVKNLQTQDTFATPDGSFTRLYPTGARP